MSISDPLYSGLLLPGYYADFDYTVCLNLDDFTEKPCGLSLRRLYRLLDSLHEALMRPVGQLSSGGVIASTVPGGRAEC
jgi:hypothetical protein